MHNAHLGTVNVTVNSARGTAHPPVLLSLPLKPDQGNLPAGLLLMESPSGLIPWVNGDSGANGIAGVLDTDVDTSRQDNGLVIVHGSAVKEMLVIGVDADTEPDDATLTALIKAGVFPE